mmetsp:Transcript_7663/g.8424  ORF Transcript_7663/g.8424 Transcript_7663/m.8424 type:complete len:95 (+) Transcript_7663:505-789(+)
MKISLPRGMVDKGNLIHDLAFICSTLNEKNLVLGLDDLVRIGTKSLGSITVKFSRFCHAFLQKETSTLYPYGFLPEVKDVPEIFEQKLKEVGKN